MSESGTLDRTDLDHERYIVVVTNSDSEATRELPASATPRFQWLTSRFEMAILPLTVMAAFAAPGVGGEYSRTVIRTRSSRSIVDFRQWDSDAWQYTEEFADLVQIEALNALLALPASEGEWFELDDD